MRIGELPSGRTCPTRPLASCRTRAAGGVQQRPARQTLAALDQAVAEGELDAERPQQPQRRAVGRVDQVDQAGQAGADGERPQGLHQQPPDAQAGSGRSR